MSENTEVVMYVTTIFSKICMNKVGLNSYSHVFNVIAIETYQTPNFVVTLDKMLELLDYFQIFFGGVT